MNAVLAVVIVVCVIASMVLENVCLEPGRD